MTDASPGAPRFDLIVIGGGIIGCGIARDAALRGLKVALVEKHDFGSGTTSGSTRLIHGGLRYLQTGDFGLVRLDLREREILLKLAPHLVKPIPFLLPLPKRSFGRLKLRIGMHLYDALSYDKSLPSHRILGADELAKAEPALDATRFHGAALFYDAQCAFPERLALENVVDAHAHGAVVHNYAEVVGAIREGDRLVGVQVKHVLEGGHLSELRGRVVVNASGPWFDRVAGVIEAAPEPRVRATKGIHIACENVLNGHALVLESPIDGRTMFAIPWNGYTWVGTTDTDFEGDPAAAHATEDDIGYLLESVIPYLPALKTAKKFWTMAGVRALVRSSGWASGVSRAHKLRKDVPGLVSVIGGKLTGYRAIAEEVTDLVASQLSHTGQSSTATIVLPGGGTARSGAPNLDRIYGSRASLVDDLASTATAFDAPMVAESPDIVGQVIFAARHDWCRTVEDYMLRRSDIGLRPDRTLHAAPHVAQWLASELEWPAGRDAEQVEAYRTRASRTLLPDGAAYE